MQCAAPCPFRAKLRLALVFVAASTMLVAAPASADHHRDVLLLNSYHHGYAWSDGIVSAAADAFAQRDDVDLHVEYMDTKRYPNEPNRTAFREFLSQKYAADAFSLILCSDDNALSFMLEHRATLFPTTPVVFCGTNYFADGRVAGYANITGVNESLDVADTLRVAARLHPEARHVIVIEDTSPSGTGSRQTLNECIDQFADRFRFVFYTNNTPEQIVEKLRAAPPDSIVLLLALVRTADGEPVEWPKSDLLVKNCPFPVYVCWDFLLGRGVLGGKIASSRRQGEEAARLASMILDGAPADSIPIIHESPNVYAFRYDELTRFGIAADSLPEGALIWDRPWSFWREHRALVLTSAAFMAAETGMIAALLVFWRLRRRAMRALRDSEARVRALFAGIDDTVLVFTSQGEIVECNDAACRRLGRTRDALIGMNMQDIKTPEFAAQFKERAQRLNEGQEGSYESEFVAANGRVIVVHVNTRPVHYDGQAALLSVARDITDRKEAETALQRHSRLIETLVDTIPHPIFYKDAKGEYLGCNRKFAELFADGQRESVIGHRLSSLSPRLAGETVESYELQDQSLIDTPGDVINEEKFRGPDGALRFYMVGKATFADAEGAPAGVVGVMMDITDRKEAEREREKLIAELRRALAEVKTLSGLLPICASCKKVRDDQGYWEQIEVYLGQHSDAQFSHGLCPECIRRLYPDLADRMEKKREDEAGEQECAE